MESQSISRNGLTTVCREWPPGTDDGRSIYMEGR
nr:MAG TPA: hypothetical protein [Caudoviricetes sp.]